MLEDLQTLFWYLKRPKLYSALIDLILRTFFLKRKDDVLSLKAADAWCKDECIEINKLYDELGIENPINFSEISTKEYIKEVNKKIEVSDSDFGGGGELDVVLNICELIESKVAIETGVAYGWSSSAILHSISKRGGNLISIDMPMPKQADYELIGCAVETKHMNNWTLLREPDKYGLLKAIKTSKNLDFVHYDSDKNYYGRKWAVPIIMKNLIPGGFFVCDDIQDNLHFKEYVEDNSYKYWVIKKNTDYVGIIKKNL